MAGSLEEALLLSSSNDTTVRERYKFEISNDLRTITVPPDLVFGVFNDRNVQTIDFEMPRYYHDLDLSDFSIRVNYVTGEHSDIYLVLDKTVTSNKITFSWTVDIGAYLQNGGSVTFNVCLRKVNQSNEVTHEFNTTIYTVKVLEGLEVEPADPSVVLDYLTQIQQLVAGLEDYADELADEIAEDVRQSVYDDFKPITDAQIDALFS